MSVIRKEIVILSGKGGTGKTTLALNLSTIIDEKLIIDCDVDAPNMHIVLNPEVIEREEFYGGFRYEIDGDLCTNCGVCYDLCNFDAILRGEKYFINEVKCDYCGVCYNFCDYKAIKKERRLSGHFFISDTRYGKFIYASLIPGEENSGRLVSRIRNLGRERFSELNYFIIDGLPGIGCPVISSITGSNFVIVVCEPTLSSIHDLRRIIELTTHFKVKSGIVINKFDINGGLTEEIEAFCKEEGIPLLGKIPFSFDILDSLREGKTLVEYGSKLVKEFKSIWYNLRSILD